MSNTMHPKNFVSDSLRRREAILTGWRLDEITTSSPYSVVIVTLCRPEEPKPSSSLPHAVSSDSTASDYLSKTHTHTYIHTHTHLKTHTITHSVSKSPTHRHMKTHTNTHAKNLVHTHTHKHAYMHISTQTSTYCLLFSFSCTL